MPYQEVQVQGDEKLSGEVGYFALCDHPRQMVITVTGPAFSSLEEAQENLHNDACPGRHYVAQAWTVRKLSS